MSQPPPTSRHASAIVADESDGRAGLGCDGGAGVGGTASGNFGADIYSIYQLYTILEILYSLYKISNIY